MRLTLVFTAFMHLSIASWAPARPDSSESNPAEIARLVRSCEVEDTAVAARSAAELRALGQPGLDALCDEHQRLLNEIIQDRAGSMDARTVFASTGASVADPLQATATDDPRIARLRAAIDAVAKQRDAYVSRLYWYTDLEDAKAQATADGKPILSLRLLGNLDDDLSCANSRFFRSVLYANASVSAYLREHFILHWESLRPVPKLTIDFGDGRRIERTITGNSVHYVLDSHGRVIDGLPGLYGPAAFLEGLKSAEEIAVRSSKLAADDREAFDDLVRRYHLDAASSIEERLRTDLKRLRETGPNGASSGRAEVPSEAWRGELSDEVVARMANLHIDDVRLDAGSIMVIRSKVPADFLKVADRAQRAAPSKRGPEAPVMAMIRTLHRSVAEDTVRNEYMIHRRMHHMMMEIDIGLEPREALQALNARVYAELLSSPLDDPWMGLAPRDAYAAIDGGGLIQACK